MKRKRWCNGTYQYCGKLSLSSSHQRSSSHSLSRSRGGFPSFWADCDVVLLVIMAGRDAPTALRTSVMDELPEACPDFRRWWCIGTGDGDWPR